MSFPPKTVLVPIDGSDGALRAAGYAGQFARLAGASVILARVHLSDIYQLSVLAELPPLTDFEYLAGLEARMNDPANDPAFSLARSALGQVARVEDKILWGQPAAMLCAYAQDRGIEHIIIGARGRSAFNALLVGSVCSQVLHHAGCPVTVIH